MNINFDKQIALVTGGSRGIGKQVSIDLENLGAKVIVTGTKKEEPDFIGKGNFEYISVNFAIKEDLENFIKKLSKLAKLDICINNAGINLLNFLGDVVHKDLEEMFLVNLEAPYKIINTISNIMKNNSYGRIINISSIFGELSREKRSAYTVTKYGIRGLTVTSSIELAKYNVLVNTVSPGFTLTDLTKKNLKPEEMKDLESKIPIGRMAQVQEISSVILYLSSKNNTYITGQNINVDGGFTNV